MTHFNTFYAVLADATTAAPAAGSAASTTLPASQPQGSPLGMFIPLILVVVIFYFLMIRPQSQQRKQQATLQDSLKSGDRVVTTSGIVGIIITVKDKTISLRSADSKMEVTKSSVVEILERGSDEKSAS